MDLKPFRTHDELIVLLKKRNIKIRNERLAKKVLSNENYYSMINGYKDIFLQTSNPDDVFRPGTTFSEILYLYSFDRKLRELLLIELLRIEHSIKSHVIYVFSQKHGHKHTSYLRTESFNIQSFVNFKRANTLVFRMLRLIDKYEKFNSPIKHYMDKYGFVPLWVLGKVMTFGNLNYFYSCMLYDEKKEVADSFKLSPEHFERVLDFLSDFRNRCAHGERIYCSGKDRKKAKPIPYLGYHAALKLPNNGKGYKYYASQDILALLIVMKYFMQQDRYQELLKNIDIALHQKLQKRLHSVSIHQVEDIMGLNGNWMDLRDL